MTLKEVHDIDDKELMKRYEKLLDRYKTKREVFVEHVQNHSRYYGFSTGAGQLRLDETIEVFDLPDDDLFE